MGFQQGLSGLNVSSKNLEVIGNNVANANTFGAKTSRAEFADVYAKALNGSGSSAVGIGARVAAVAQQFTQGNISTTENQLDLAINGDGFFQVQRYDPDSTNTTINASGPILYSRNGQFKLDKDGYVVNNEGHHLLGQSPGSTNPSAPIKLGLSGGTAKATTKVTDKINLDAAAAPPTANTPAFDPTNKDSFNYAPPQTIYDDSGESVGLQYYFVKSAPDSWNVYASANNTFLNSTPGTPPTYNPVASIVFPPSGVAPTSVTDANGVNLGNGTFVLPTIPAGTASPTQSDITGVVMDFSGFTQFASKSSTNDQSQNGYAKGDFASFNVDTTGSILVRYTNGQTVAEAQVLTARFNNPQGLQPEGGTEWSVTAGSGAPQLGSPGTSKLGLLQGGALEESNVDLTGELVNMIVAQRMYQANAQTIKTEDQVLQTLVSLR
jgi:flagellar hook protein FlgE